MLGKSCSVWVMQCMQNCYGCADAADPRALALQGGMMRRWIERPQYSCCAMVAEAAALRGCRCCGCRGNSKDLRILLGHGG